MVFSTFLVIVIIGLIVGYVLIWIRTATCAQKGFHQYEETKWINQKY